MVFVAFTLPFKVLSSKPSFCPTSDDVMSLSFAPLLSPCAMNSGSGKKQTETNLICVCGFLPNVSNFKTDKSGSHCKHNKVVINNNNPYLLHIQMTAWETSLIKGCTHTHLLHTRRDLQSRFLEGKNSLKGLNFNTKWRKILKGTHGSIFWRRRWKSKVCLLQTHLHLMAAFA